jgi:hypothetical protein
MSVSAFLELETTSVMACVTKSPKLGPEAAGAVPGAAAMP